MEKNKPVILYGAGYRGSVNFVALAAENVHVEAFCDRDAGQIPQYYGCEVYTAEEAIKKYPSLPYLVCIDNETARNEVAARLKAAGMEVYTSFDEFYQGLNDVNKATVRCGRGASFQVVPALLEGKKNAVAYSFGVGFDYSFELELVEKYGLKVYAFDPSPGVKEEMTHQVLPERLEYYAYGLSDVDAVKTFYQPSSGTDYSEYFASWTSAEKTEMQVYRLATLMEKLGHKHLDLLKMDVEGSEYLALPDILNSGVTFDQLCIETHARIFPDSVEKIRWIKTLLNEHGYLLVSNKRQEQTYIHESVLDMC